MDDDLEPNVEIYYAPRRSGKTRWLIEQMAEAQQRGESVAVLVANPPSKRRMEQSILSSGTGLQGPVPVIIPFELRRPRRGRVSLAESGVDHVFVDDSDRFQDDTVSIIRGQLPNASVTMTVTSKPPPERTQDLMTKIVRYPHHLRRALIGNTRKVGPASSADRNKISERIRNRGRD